MGRSKIERELNLLVKEIEENLGLLKKANKLSSFSQIHKQMIAELVFLKIYTAWEQFLENTFLLYARGYPSKNKHKPRRIVIIKTEKNVVNMIKGGKEFISWNTSSIIQRTQLFFEGGGPYDFLRNYQINFDEIRIIRNSIAHKSKNAKRKFEEFIKKNYLQNTQK